MKSIRRTFAGFITLALTFASAPGCGGGNEKAVIPETFTPRPEKGPSVVGAPAPAPGAKKGKGGAPADL